MGTEEVKTKLSIEEMADNLLIFKDTGKRKEEFPIPAKQPKEFAEVVEYLEKRCYVIKKGEGSKSLRYDITPIGEEHTQSIS